MDIDSRLAISYYQTVATINEAHKVYLVQHTQTGKICVKKTLSVYSIDIYNFIKENPIPGVPRIYDLYEENSKLTIIEEYIAGQTLREMLDSGLLSSVGFCDIMIKLCSILWKLHSNKPAIVHRDLKPTNIMITSADAVILPDLNTSKFSSGRSGRESDTQLLGTEGYAAPEQYGFGESSPRTDIYAIGMIIKEAVPLLADRRIAWGRIVSKCTQIDPRKRYKTVMELKQDLIKLAPNDDPEKEQLRPEYSFLPPGFRTRKPENIVIGLIGYAAMLSLLISFIKDDIKDGITNINVLILRGIIYFLLFFGTILFIFNYRNIHRFVPPYRKNNKIIRIICIIVIVVIWALFLAVALAFIEKIALP